jgi:hypothetical protein
LFLPDFEVDILQEITETNFGIARIRRENRVICGVLTMRPDHDQVSCAWHPIGEEMAHASKNSHPRPLTENALI